MSFESDDQLKTFYSFSLVETFLSSVLSTVRICFSCRDARHRFCQPISISDNHLLLMANTDKTTDHFIFLYFTKKLIACSLCTSESKTG